MVTFTCGNCNSSIKKNQVNKHCESVCKNAWEFTCIDCHKVFTGFEFDAHTSCITESEKYYGKYHQPKVPVKRQREWRGWRNEIKDYLKEKAEKGVNRDELKRVILLRYKESDGKLDDQTSRKAYEIKVNFDRFIKRGDKFYYYRYLA